MAKIKKQFGFSMIELIVSMSIVAMITGIFLANYRRGDDSNKLNLSAQILESNIRLSQNLSLGATSTNGSSGIHFDTANNNYFIFTDDNDNMSYDFGEEDEGRIFYLPDGVLIDNLNIGGSSFSDLNITFLPPNPIVRIYNGSSTSTTAVIRLKQESTEMTKNIKINIFGTVEIID